VAQALGAELSIVSFRMTTVSTPIEEMDHLGVQKLLK